MSSFGVEENPDDPTQKKIPSTPTLAGLAKIAKNYKACELWKRGTQTVFGEGESDAKVMFVGEVPGDQEYLAGNLLNKALAEAGIDRGKIYVTNAVKHFNWEPRGKRREEMKRFVADLKKIAKVLFRYE